MMDPRLGALRAYARARAACRPCRVDNRAMTLFLGSFGVFGIFGLNFDVF